MSTVGTLTGSTSCNVHALARSHKHRRATLQADIKRLTTMSAEELAQFARENSAPLHLVRETATRGALPVPNFAAGGIATPADAALLRQLGAETVFVGSGM